MTLYMGFDIGDAESIIAFAKGDDQNVLMATMPGMNAAGIAIATLYGYSEDGKLQLADSVAGDGHGLKEVAVNFKRCPSDLVDADAAEKARLLAMDDDQLWGSPELEKIREFSVKLNTFVSVVLTHPDFVKYLDPQLDSCTECKVAVGHPTRWSDFDVRVYQLMLRHGLLGQEKLRGVNLSLNLYPESRAAFLYVRDAYKLKVSPSMYSGIVDVGSSTIDISVMQGGDTRNFVYDKGSNFLGARSIDYLIMEYCMEQLRNSPDKEVFEDIFAVDADGRKKNPTAWDHLLINCRYAKERLFANSQQDKSRVKQYIIALDFMPVVLTYDKLVNDICNRPIAPVLKKYCALSDVDGAWLGNMGWREAFKAFLKEQKGEMAACGIQLSQIFFTGSASRMPFVREITDEIFTEIDSSNELKNDTNPSNAIANGLARVGVSDDKAAEFAAEIECYVSDKDRLLRRVKSRIPDLIADVSMPILDVMEEQIVIKRFQEWQNGKFKNVNKLMAAISADMANEDYMGELLRKDSKFSAAIGTWIGDKLGNDIANDLLAIAVKYHVTEFKAQDLNIFRIKGISVGGENILGDSKIISVNPIQTVISTLVGVVTALIAPFVVGVIIGLTYLISESIFWSLVVALLECPEPVFSTFIGALGLAAGMLAKNTLKSPKNSKRIQDFVNNLNLQVWIRKMIKVDTLRREFRADKPEISEKMQAKFCEADNVDKLVKEIGASVRGQVQKKADEIRYVIISR